MTQIERRRDETRRGQTRRGTRTGISGIGGEGRRGMFRGGGGEILLLANVATCIDRAANPRPYHRSQVSVLQTAPPPPISAKAQTTHKVMIGGQRGTAKGSDCRHRSLNHEHVTDLSFMTMFMTHLEELTPMTQRCIFPCRKPNVCHLTPPTTNSALIYIFSL